MRKTGYFLPLSVVAFMLVGCKGKETQYQVDELLVETEQVQLSCETADVPYVGTVEEMESTLASFTGTGTLQTVPVEEGQTIHKGQVIAVLDKVQAQNAVNVAKAMLDQAKDAQTRMRQLYDTQALPEMKWIEVESKVQQAQSSYDMAVKSLQECTLTAPVSGVVGKKFMRSGEVALPSEPIISILNINKVKVKVSVPEGEIARIDGSTQAQIHIDALNQDFVGTEIEKGVSADALTHTYDIRILVDNAAHSLLPGMVAQVKLSGMADAPAQGITLPVRSIQQDSGRSQFVWTVENGKAHRKDVVLGETVGNRVIIASGLQEGESVITSGYQKVSEGTSVKVRK